ncbi:MAG: peroxidase-related enzyme [Gammaproteobacteria bacterium]|nr:peroxidase-related enzyme [Gammaproteobacteria bacterium]NIR82924.1 peroxidase-related enzyme [Gammaproteobacteria bacterium]NIR90193.1 peroxidase-related enzyme [Gammaproteobacteria bacterium]NIU04070.1 peroxidase-related enzyme [Gammaproteobacteria bacterium]NIV51059.1 peroxidase-related enzyme [Gammaproteobacteria bacterium]
MPYIELTPVEEATGERKAVYDEVERVRGKGRVSNLFKAYAAFPALAMANFKRLNVLLGEGTLSSKLKEAILTALAEINHCDYCVSFHATAMLNAGASDEEVHAALEFDPQRLGLSPKERALFEYAMKANGDPHSITAEDIAELRKLGVTDSDLVETLETVNTGNSFNLFAGGLDVGTDSFLTYMTDRKSQHA